MARGVSAPARATKLYVAGVGLKGAKIHAAPAPKIMLIVGQSNVQGVQSIQNPPALEGRIWKAGKAISSWPDVPGPMVGVARHQLRWVYEHGVSGSSIGTWLASTMAAVKSGMDGKGLAPDVVVWDQGNKDARTKAAADAHEARLGQLDALWQDYWPGIPSIITKTTGLDHSNYPYRDIVRAAIDAHAATVAAAIQAGTRPGSAACSVLDWGTSAYPTVDGIHRTGAAQVTAGQSALAEAIRLGVMV